MARIYRLPFRFLLIVFSFVGSFLRILQKDYIPTATDNEQFDALSLDARVATEPAMVQLAAEGFSLPHVPLERGSPCLNGLAVFGVSLSSYGNCDIHSSHEKPLYESLDQFGSKMHSYDIQSVALVFSNVNHFRAKLAEVSLTQYFSDYTGVPGCYGALDYLLCRFASRCNQPLRIYALCLHSIGAEIGCLIYNVALDLLGHETSILEHHETSRFQHRHVASSGYSCHVLVPSEQVGHWSSGPELN